MKKRVAITGMGVITPNALNLPQFLSALREGKSGISTIKSFSTAEMRVHIGGEIKEITIWPEDLDRVSYLARLAAKEAFLHAGLAPVLFNAEKAGVSVGTISGGILTLENVLLHKKNEPHLKNKLAAATTAKTIAERLGLQGGELTSTNACAAGTVALGLAFDKIRSGAWKIALAGGCGSFYLLAFAGFHALRSLDPLCCRPFDKERDGLVVGEGAGFLVLEDYALAQERGAAILAEVVGFGITSDAYHETAPQPDGEGAARAMQNALSDAELNAEEIDYINAHGTGTKQNDRMETLAIKQVFREQAYKMPVSSTKSMVGHLMGAAGAVEAVASILAIQHNFIPPTINYKVPDPECDLDYVPNHAREKKLQYVLSANYGFGGCNAAIICKRSV